MLKVGIGAFSRAIHQIGMIRGCGLGIRSAGSDLEEYPLADGESLRTEAQKHLSTLRPELIVLDVPVTLAAADRLSRQLKERPDLTHGDLWNLCEQIEARLFDELASRSVFVLDAKHAQYFSQENFGPEVVSKFPSASYDIDEAMKSLALGRSTACVYHLMRAMETALKAVHQCLGIQAPVSGQDRAWGNILNRIRDNIKARGAAFQEKELFHEMFALLDSVKEAWRNATMHADEKKTEEEAEAILLAVRGFMKKVASRMDENGDPKAP